MRAASFKSLYQKRPMGVCRRPLLSGGRSRYSTKTYGDLFAISEHPGKYLKILIPAMGVYRDRFKIRINNLKAVLLARSLVGGLLVDSEAQNGEKASQSQGVRKPKKYSHGGN